MRYSHGLYISAPAVTACALRISIVDKSGDSFELLLWLRIAHGQIDHTIQFFAINNTATKKKWKFAVYRVIDMGGNWILCVCVCVLVTLSWRTEKNSLINRTLRCRSDTCLSQWKRTDSYVCDGRENPREPSIWNRITCRSVIRPILLLACKHWMHICAEKNWMDSGKRGLNYIKQHEQRLRGDALNASDCEAAVAFAGCLCNSSTN